MDSSSIVRRVNVQLSVIYASCIAFLVLSWLSVVMRVYVRTRLIRRFGYDDWTMLLTLACFTATCGISITLVEQIRDLLKGTKQPDPEFLRIVTRLASGLYVLTMVFLKMSLGFFLLKIFTIDKPKRIIVIVVVCVCSVFSLVYFFWTLIGCAASATFYPTGEVCHSVTAYSHFTTFWNTLNASTDLLFALLATLAMWNVKLPLLAKISTGGLLVLGTLGGIASLIRLGLLLRQSNQSNQIVHSLQAGYWTIIEAGIGITVASLATLRPLFRCCIERAKTGLTGLTTNVAAGTRGRSGRPSMENIYELDASGASVKVVSEATSKATSTEDDVELGLKDESAVNSRHVGSCHSSINSSDTPRIQHELE